MNIVTEPHLIDANKWSDFVNHHINGNVFHSPEFFSFLEESEGYSPQVIVIEDDQRKLLGILVYSIIKEYTGLFGSLTARSVIWGGPLVEPDNQLEITEKILETYDKKIRGKVIYSQFRNLFSLKNQKKIFESKGFKYEEHLDFHNPLNITKDELFNSIHKSRKRNFTKALNKGSEFKELNTNEEIISAYSLIKSTYDKIKLPCPSEDFFINAHKRLHNNGLIRYFGAFVNGKLIGTRIVLTYNKMIYDWYAGADSNELNKYPNDFLPLSIMLWGIDNGFTLFDFGGAGKPDEHYGVRDHKEKFGGALVEFGRFEKIHKPFLLQISKLGFKFWKVIRY
jgi:serine/alanine adding enzyme